MDKPIRVQRKRIKGWRMPENTVYVGRPTKWGNPYQVGIEEYDPKGKRMETVIPKTIEECIELFKAFLLNLNPLWTQANIAELKGKNLACFCPLDKPCHADILLEIANQ